MFEKNEKTKKRPWLGHFYKNIFMRSVNKASLQPNTLSQPSNKYFEDLVYFSLLRWRHGPSHARPRTGDVHPRRNRNFGLVVLLHEVPRGKR